MKRPILIQGKALSSRTLKQALTNSYGKNRTKEGFDGYEPVSNLTDTEAQVYYNPKTQQAIVSHRGTQGFGDVFQDVAYGLTGYKGRRFKKAERVQKEAERMFGSQNVSTVGHSLGSLISSDVGRNSKEIINYNKPIVPFGRKRENEYVVKTSNDPFSWFYKTKKNDPKVKTIESKSINPLYEHSTDRLDALNPEEMIGLRSGAGLKVKELKQLIKDHNKKAKSPMKIKGYGMMKKKELQGIVHSFHL